MRFGEILGELTGLCSVKRCNLAAALGYDASYVSRWISGQKLPALRNNDALLGQMAGYLGENCPPERRGEIVERFALECEDSNDVADFSGALLQLLMDTYRADRKQMVPRAVKSEQCNASLSSVKETVGFPESIFESLRELSNSNRQLEMVCTMPIHAQFKNNEFFFQRVLDAVGPDCSVRILQFVDLDELAERVDISCRSFCYLMGLRQKITYEFYEYRNGKAGYIYLIRDGLLLQYLRVPFSREMQLMETRDPEVVGKYGVSAANYVRNRPAMTQREPLGKLLQNQYFLDYFMQPRCRCLLKRMQPLFFPEELQEKLLSGQKEMMKKQRLFLDGSQFFESILLYQSALVDYIYTGKLMAFGSTVEIAPEDRLVHLQYMLRQLQENPGKLYILSTQNSICSYDDLPTSLFLSQHTAFALTNEENRDRVAYTVSSTGMNRQLNVWLDHMEALPPEQCLTGQDAIAYISRCIRLL